MNLEKEKPSGFILINKPAGPSSFAIVRKLRVITGIKKIGHAGTLDPLASGLLICAIGRDATKKIDSFLKLDKEYSAEMELGKISDTYDLEGKIETGDNRQPTEEELKSILQSFTGEIWQAPPIFSAKKVGGIAAYKLARRGETPKIPIQQITIYAIELIKYNYPKTEILVHCGSGTYIRSLVNDIGQKLGTGAIMTKLTRISVGQFHLKNSININELTKSNWTDFLF